MENTIIQRTILHFLRKEWAKRINDRNYLQLLYFGATGKILNLNHPVTFNEKLQWLKLNDQNPLYTSLVDKYEVKNYVASILGDQYIIPTYGVWNSFEDIPFVELPKQFVLKCTHDSGGLVICKNKEQMDYSEAQKRINKSLQTNYYWIGREWPYKNICPRVLAERYMEDFKGKGELTDYKLHFFSGECKAIMVGQNRFGPNGLENDFYTPDWKHFDFTRGHSHNAPTLSQRPDQLDKMIELGMLLAKNLPFVRIDFYVINNKVYFGEITFFPGSGLNAFHPDKWDKIFGDWIRLPINVKI